MRRIASRGVACAWVDETANCTCVATRIRVTLSKNIAGAPAAVVRECSAVGGDGARVSVPSRSAGKCADKKD
jgi:hypothetical protein